MTVVDYDPYAGEYWEDEWAEDVWEDAYGYASPATRQGLPFHPLMLVGLALLVFFGFVLILPSPASDGASPAPRLQPTVVAPPVQANPRPAAPVLPSGPDAFLAPYTEYWVTQGPHGFDYGHMAVDIAAGKGAPIMSPIAGTVTEKFTDGIGNPVLVIENEVYQVTLLHGIYTVQPGDRVAAGDLVGEESNIGNTTDMRGRSCRNRDCGYHTHLNVFDKRKGANVNPLTLLEGTASP